VLGAVHRGDAVSLRAEDIGRGSQSRAGRHSLSPIPSLRAAACA
jgi:hypothetical protein